MRISFPVLLLIVTVACLALGVALHANLWEVVAGLLLGGGVSCGLIYLIRLLQPRDTPQDRRD
jgi:hypothetical protein